MFRIRPLLTAMAIAVCLATFQLQSVAAAESEADSISQFAQRQLGKPFQLGANGLRRYDCSGLVYRTFKENGLLTRIGGSRTSYGYYNWFKNNGRLTSSPKRGDLVVWAKRGKRVSHIGIFKGYNKRGKPVAVSALTSGVAVHRVHGYIGKPFKAYLRVNLDR